MGTAKPSPIIVMDIDESLDSPELRLEVARCYPNVGAVQLRTHSGEEGQPPHNTVRLMTLFGMRSYLDSRAEGADERWNNVLLKWYESIVGKLCNHMKIFNRRQREIEGTEIYFDELVIELQEGALEARFHLDSNCDLPAREVRRLDQLREFYNSGMLGQGVAAVRMPSAASYEQQRVAGLEARAQAEARAEEEARAEQAAREQAALQAEQEAEEDFLESPALNKQMAQEAGELDLEALGYEIERKYSFPAVDFVIRYEPWDIVNQNGACREFNPATRSFMS
ncbi:MAG: hypothetical protein ACI36Y_06875 [Coriobacteriales bacterium]